MKRKCLEEVTSSTTTIYGAQYDWICRDVKDCPVYSPTLQQCEDPLLYLHSIAQEASQYGICKIDPAPCQVFLTSNNCPLRNPTKFQTFVHPLRADMNNGATITSSKGRKLSGVEFETFANKASIDRFGFPARGSVPMALEIEFWRELLDRQDKEVIIGFNMETPSFSTPSRDTFLRSSNWNLKKFPKLPNSVLRHMDADAIQGVTKPILELGMIFGMFAWHVEENHLFSISYHHMGEPKIWYGVPGSKAELLEEVVEKHIFNGQFPLARGKNVADVLAKRSCMFPPNMLMDHGVPVFRAYQRPGEFIVTFPKAYHAGFSTGFNLCEKINFATSDWLSFGARGCLNYAQIETSHIIPYEELVCKESMLLWNDFGRKLSSVQTESAIAFSILVRTHHLIRWCLWKLKGESVAIVPKSGDINMNCGKCHRNCYIAYMTCKGSSSPTCMFHDLKEVQDNLIFVHEDVLAIETKAKLLEENNKVKERVMDHICWMGKSDLFRWMLSALLKGGYHPYCHIKEYSWLNQETKPLRRSFVASNNCQIKKENSSGSGRVLSNNNNQIIKKEITLRSGRVVLSNNNCQIKKEKS